MSARSDAVGALILLGTHTALLAGAIPAEPAAAVALATLVLTLSPGLAWLRILHAEPPGGSWLAPGWALGLGIAWNAILLSACAVTRVPFTMLAGATLPLNAGLWVFALFRVHRHRAATGAGVGPDSAPEVLSGSARMLTLAAAALAAVWVLRLGAPLLYISDSPDHIATIRRMIEHRELFPSDAFFRDAGAAGVDPRKFLWHGDVALIALLAHVSPLAAWRNLPVVLAPLLILNAAALGMLLAGSAGAALTAWILLLTYGGSLATSALRETVYAAKLADQLALAASVAVLADLARPVRRTRLAACALAAAAASVHVFAAFQFTLAFGALAVGLWMRDRRWSESLRRLAGTVFAAGIAVAPFVLWQVLRTPRPMNPIHTEPQGLLWLWDGVRVVSPGVVWEWFGAAWWIVPLLLVALWRESRERAATLWLVTTSLAVAMVLFAPPLVDLLQPRVGYLLMRVVWMTPLAGIAAWGIVRLGRLVRTASGGARLGFGLLLGACALALAPGVVDAVHAVTHAGSTARVERERSPLPWAGELEWMNTQLAAGSVVLSDPVTSYSVPMLTSHHVVTLLDQHSSPSDSHALDRLLDARDALDPAAGLARTREVVRRYAVDAIVLNDRFCEVPPLDYWAPSHPWFAAERAHLEAFPEVFPRVLDHGDFVVYRVDRAALEKLSAPAPARAGVASYRPGRDPIAHRMGEGSPMLLDLSLSPREASPGDSLCGVIRWECDRALPAGGYRVAVRFDRELPDGVDPPRLLSKPVRKLLEKLHRERYRFRDDHLPVGGTFGVDLWPPGAVVRDSFTVAVPADIASGEYRIQVRMMRQPHYANLRLSDYFFDDDYFAGLEVGRMRIVRARDFAPDRARGVVR